MSIIELLMGLMIDGGLPQYSGEWLKEKSKLSSEEINVIIVYLETVGRVEIDQDHGVRGPYCFTWVKRAAGLKGESMD